MKRSISVVAILLALACGCARNTRQENPTDDTKPAAEGPRIAALQTIPQLPTLEGGGQPANTNTVLPPEPLILMMRTNALPARSVPPPGVYRIEPYSMIVVVPGSCGDEKMILGEGEPTSRMPVIRPGLRFIPFGRNHK